MQSLGIRVDFRKIGVVQRFFIVYFCIDASVVEGCCLCIWLR